MRWDQYEVVLMWVQLWTGYMALCNWYNINVLVLCRVMWYVGRCIMGCRWWLGWSVSFGLVTASPCGACCFGRRRLGRLCWSWIGRGGWRRSRGCWEIIVIVIIFVILYVVVFVTLSVWVNVLIYCIDYWMIYYLLNTKVKN